MSFCYICHKDTHLACLVLNRRHGHNVPNGASAHQFSLALLHSAANHDLCQPATEGAALAVTLLSRDSVPEGESVWAAWHGKCETGPSYLLFFPPYPVLLQGAVRLSAHWIPSPKCAPRAELNSKTSKTLLEIIPSFISGFSTEKDEAMRIVEGKRVFWDGLRHISSLQSAEWWLRCFFVGQIAFLFSSVVIFKSISVPTPSKIP